MFGSLFENEEDEEETLFEKSSQNPHQGVSKPRCPPAPRGETGICGLQNQGATCYLNSLLQTLFFTPEFRGKSFLALNTHKISFSYILHDLWGLLPDSNPGGSGGVVVVGGAQQSLVGGGFTPRSNPLSTIFDRKQGCALRNIERRPVIWTCKIPAAQHMICMKNLRFSSHPRAKVRCQGPPGSARAQPLKRYPVSYTFYWPMLPLNSQTKFRTLHSFKLYYNSFLTDHNARTFSPLFLNLFKMYLVALLEGHSLSF